MDAVTDYVYVTFLDVINFMCFQAFLLYTHYMRENVRIVSSPRTAFLHV